MENKILEKEIIVNLSKSFNLKDLHQLLNISFEKFKIAKEYQKTNPEKSNNHFQYSINILNQVDILCSNNNCNQEIKNKVKKAIENIGKIEKTEKTEKNDLNNIQEGGTENQKSKSVQEIIIPGYQEINTLLEKSIHGSNQNNNSDDNKKKLLDTFVSSSTNNLENNSMFYLINEKYREKITKYIVQPLNYPELYKKNFNSILFYGYKGNGKSFIVDNLIKEINNDFVIKKQINIKEIIENEGILRESFIDINKLIDNNQEKKIIIIIEDIDVIIDKEKSEYLYDFIYKYSQKKNIFIIATSNSPWKLNKNINKTFEKKIYIEFPEIEDKNKYFLYKIFEYLNISQNFNYQKIDTMIKENVVFNVPILKDIKSINKISKKCQDKKCSYYDLNIIVNKLFNISALSSIKNNIFQKEISDKVYFINSSSIFEEEYKQINTYVLNPPEYVHINYKGIEYESYNYFNKNINFEDERLNNIYKNKKNK